MPRLKSIKVTLYPKASGPESAWWAAKVETQVDREGRRPVTLGIEESFHRDDFEAVIDRLLVKAGEHLKGLVKQEGFK